MSGTYIFVCQRSSYFQDSPSSASYFSELPNLFEEWGTCTNLLRLKAPHYVKCGLLERRLAEGDFIKQTEQSQFRYYGDDIIQFIRSCAFLNAANCVVTFNKVTDVFGKEVDRALAAKLFAW